VQPKKLSDEEDDNDGPSMTFSDVEEEEKVPMEES
jgi:hypothetical protein